MKCYFCEKETSTLLCEHCGCDNGAVEESQEKETFSNIVENYQTNQEKSQDSYKIASAICYIMSAIFVVTGFFKILVYDGDVNAYVGGDAYNIIINATYAAAYFVLATMFVIMALGFNIIKILNDNKK